MNQTEHYGLNQWDLSDRILMSDFNADNAKIDAALAGKLGHAHTIHKFPSSGGHILGSGSNPTLFDWDQYEYCALYVEFPDLSQDFGKTLEVSFGTQTQPFSMSFPLQTFILFFFCQYDSSRKVKGLLLCEKPQFFALDFTYTEMGTIRTSPAGSDTAMPDPSKFFLGWK